MICQELVELVTNYLEGRLPDDLRNQVDAHLAACDGCTAYIEQMRATLAALGRIPEESIPAHARDELIAAFRDLRASA
jgi:anti-sigma factor RsiW